jgi:hypothetical protein
MQSPCVQTRLRLFQQLPATIVSADMIELFTRHEPACATLYAVTTTDRRIVVTDNRAVAVVAQDPDAVAPLLAFAPIGRLRPYAHCLRRFVLGAYLPAGGNYDALSETYGGETRRVTRAWLDRTIQATGDAAAQRVLRRRETDAAAKRTFDSLLACINHDTFAAAGNGMNGASIPWCAAVIAAVACRIVAGRNPCAMPHVPGFTIDLCPL